jgi:fused signal recognition particle receptor
MKEKKTGGLFGRLGKTRESLGSGLFGLFKRGIKIDELLYEEIEDNLLMADLGVEASQSLTEHLRQKVTQLKLEHADELIGLMRDVLTEKLDPVAQPFVVIDAKPMVVLMVGVNGVGKTTTLAKMAHRLKNEGNSVMLAACDTFRAAAIEQLKMWGERLDIPVIAQQHGGDAAAVAFDAYQSAVSKGVDVLLIDSAGRQHTHGDLMAQLEKLIRVLKKANPDLPHEVMLTVDAGTGQNAFKQTVGVNSLSVTKLDGTAKGGVMVAIAQRFGLPIRYIGVGESMEDLRPFNAADFASALVPETLGEKADESA